MSHADRSKPQQEVEDALSRSFGQYGSRVYGGNVRMKTVGEGER
jgi:hypothetical protein